MKIAIIFGDNDFYNCFHGVREVLIMADRWNGLPEDKEKLCLIINEISYGCYLLFQNQFKYNEEQTGSLCERTKKYLQKLDASKILIDEEVDEYLANTDWNNSETFIVDTEIGAIFER